MNNKTPREELEESIFMLKRQQTRELQEIRSLVNIPIESLKPVSLIKETIHEIVTSPEVKEFVVSGLLGLVTGYLSKKIVVGNCNNPLMKLVGTVLQCEVTNWVAKHYKSTSQESEE